MLQMKLHRRLIKDITLSKVVHMVDGAYRTHFNVTEQSDSNYESKQGRTDAGDSVSVVLHGQPKIT